MNPFEVQPNEQLVFDFLEDDPIFQRARFARMTAEPMLSLIRPRIEELVHDRVELELLEAMPLLAERLFEDVWKEKLNKDVESFILRNFDRYMEILDSLDRIMDFFGLSRSEDEVYGDEESDDDWWRAASDDDEDSGPIDFENYRPD